MKAVVFSLGCKVNQCEGQSMIAALRAAGVEATDTLEFADIYVLNTCSVTAEADRKSRQQIARMKKFNPAAKVYVCGCSSQNDASAFAAKEGVRIVAGTAQKQDLVQSILADMRENEVNSDTKAQLCVAQLPKTYENDAYIPQHTRTRSYIKIQDGCNNFCSYCIIPYLRGRSRSRAIDDIVAEAKQAALYTREIVFTGINASAYGPDIGESLVSLVRALAAVPVRKRFGSLECTAINGELLSAMRESGFCDHFHLSLQSGSESVLRRMNRKYTPVFFAERVVQIRDEFPDAGITTDVITGFAGETEEEFAQTKAFIKAVRFSELHVFPYSERAGTKAVALPQIDKAVRSERARVLIGIGKALQRQFLLSQQHRIHEVYAETEEDGMAVGYTSNYIKAYANIPLGQIKKVYCTELYKDGIKGEIKNEK